MPSDNDITLNIATPRGLFTNAFDKNTKIEDVIQVTVDRMGLTPGEQFELVHNGVVLQPVTRPLVSFGLADGAQLELVATGSGV